MLELGAALVSNEAEAFPYKPVDIHHHFLSFPGCRPGWLCCGQLCPGSGVEASSLTVTRHSTLGLGYSHCKGKGGMAPAALGLMVLPLLVI